MAGLAVRLIFTAVLVMPLLLAPEAGQGAAPSPGSNTWFIVYVKRDGTAAWTVEQRLPLETQEDQVGFAEYNATFDRAAALQAFSNETMSIVQRAQALTGRQMTARNFTVSLEVISTPTGAIGVIRYTFDWIGFAKVEGERVVVGDVFQGGLYLYADDTLIIMYPAGYSVARVSPQPAEAREEERELVWYGRRDFLPGEPSVELAPVGNPYAPWLALGILSAALVFSAALLPRMRSRPAARERLLMSDEERLLQVLRSAGGALFQSEIRRRTGFSKSKTSTLLSSLEARGRVAKTRRGREFLVELREA